MNGLMRRKSVSLEALHPDHRLKPSLSWWHLIPLGVGAIVGTGIYTLTGVGANLAGPAVILSFLIAGAVCACAALAYAEVATLMPASGGAYTYTYAVVGEVVAWVVGWSLLLEYSVGTSAVAVGWAGYATGFLSAIGVHLPQALTAGLLAGGLVNLPAVLIVFVIAFLLMLGTRESATVNAVLVVIKVAALALFIAVAAPRMDAANFHPFMPYGLAAHPIDGVKHGVMAAAAIIFFAFYGFDTLSTAAEETKNPGRDLPIGIIGSMLVCTAIYIAVAASAVGAVSFKAFAGSPEPLALILRQLGHGQAAIVIGAAAVIALPTVILAFLYGQSRIFFVMARDGLLPQGLSKVHARTKVPVRMTIVTAICVAALAGLAPLDQIASLANTGTLTAFVAVSACLLILRRREPDLPRIYRTPLAWVVAPGAILGCLYLFWSLPTKTRVFFLIWNLLGLVVYALWRWRKPQVAEPETAAT
ncbi:amino acid permease [Phenylobacterium montanum]|uniref:Amino acid permease n=1 Tax=Phenylobacterium montanum TaxID=2823693 RepID=A0A975FZ41_9CAUL|nr:amino acid permease [Caulobacter sp. S6]QUD87507.1 amino acid permease [Caulobacter sp. S6]